MRRDIHRRYDKVPQPRQTKHPRDITLSGFEGKKTCPGLVNRERHPPRVIPRRGPRCGGPPPTGVLRPRCYQIPREGRRRQKAMRLKQGDHRRPGL